MLFKEFTQVNYDICSEKQYFKATGKTINNSQNTVVRSDCTNSNSFLTTIIEKNNKQMKESEEKSREFPYKKCDSLLTNAELQLYHFMRNNLCQKEKIVILPKVRLGDIVGLDTNVSNNMKYYYKIASKHLDFLICNYHTLDIICAVELDDYTHETETVINRDKFIKQVLDTCNIPIVRIKTRIYNISLTDLKQIDWFINTELAPNCPYCGIKMLPKEKNGSRFWGCYNYLNGCKCTIKISDNNIGEPLP